MKNNEGLILNKNALLSGIILTVITIIIIIILTIIMTVIGRIK